MEQKSSCSQDMMSTLILLPITSDVVDLSVFAHHCRFGARNLHHYRLIRQGLRGTSTTETSSSTPTTYPSFSSLSTKDKKVACSCRTSSKQKRHPKATCYIEDHPFRKLTPANTVSTLKKFPGEKKQKRADRRPGDGLNGLELPCAVP